MKKRATTLLPAVIALMVTLSTYAFNPVNNTQSTGSTSSSQTNTGSDPSSYLGEYDPSQLNSSIRHSHRVNFYSVNPRSRQDLGAAINRASPIQGGYHGLAEWNIRWEYSYQNQGSSCRIGSVQVTLESKVHMPQLTPNQNYDASITSVFNAYYDALMHHEEGHLTHGILAANEAKQAIQDAKAASSCRAAGNNANTAANAVITKYNRADQQYDNQTNHGATQGARL